jgi:multidrug efflux pump subunit AcrA (membrane-fusion protein)
MARFQELQQKHAWFLPLLILLIAALIVFALVATKPKPPKQETTEKEWLVSAVQVEFGSAQPQIELLASVESPFSSTLSAAITADVLTVPVRDGQHVKQGDILISLDPREIRLIVAQHQANVDELDALIRAENMRFQSDQKALKEEQRLLTIAKQALKRQATLQASKLVAQERYDSAESARAQQALSVNARELNIADHPNRLSQLKARRDRANTLLKDAKIDAEKASIRAPFDGVVTQVNVAPGERIQMGQALVSLYDKDNMEIRAQVPDKYLTLIRRALTQDTAIKASTQNFEEQIDLALVRLSGQVNTRNGGLDALFQPANEKHNLVLNKALQVRLNMPALSGVVTLPIAAIYGTNRIYRIEEGRLQSMEVDILGKRLVQRPGHEGEGDLVIVRSDALKTGDKIAITQLPNAISGLKVKERD